MGIYTKIIQDSITGIYRTNAANKILQFIKRIRNESDMDQARRFLIELMQNARDLAYKTPEGDTEPVSVRIRLSDTELEFSHNGKVFSVKDILSIIYQVSSKKPGEGIGQFGTGFMSTYQLSEKVELTSYLKNGENPYLPFTVCLDRSGCSKEEILEAYLNTIGLTGNTAGVEAGANQYFGKSAADVTIAEAASIAAITKNPSRFNPYTNPEEHLKRRDDIILFMQQQGYITQAEAEAAWATPLNLVEKTTDENAAVQTDYSWFTDQVISEVIDDLVAENPLGRENWDRAAANDYLYNGGLRIYSTVDTEVQTALENVWLEGKYWESMPIENYDDPNNPDDTPRTITTQAAGVVINYKGELVGVAGGLGRKTENRGFNRGTGMTRQVGSTMKAVAAYPLGIDMDLINYSSVLMDDYFPIPDGKGGTRTDWPSNWSGRYSHSMTTVYEALKQSLNTVAVRVGDWVTPRTMFEFARETLGITTLDENSDIDLAPMVLGATTTGLSPYELAGAYMMYGDGGRMTSLHSYTSVRDYQGNEILEKDIVTTQAIGEDTAYIMNRLLHSVLFDRGGTAYGIHPDANVMDSIGKTGTTNDNKDVWFVGLTPKYVMATWYGYDQNEPMDDYNSYYIYKNKGSQKGHPGASAFAEVMDTVQADDEIVTWDMPETVEKGAFCTISGDIPTDGCPRGTGYYKTGVQRGVCTGIHATDPAA